jgi:hypothetical protein
VTDRKLRELERDAAVTGNVDRLNRYRQLHGIGASRAEEEKKEEEEKREKIRLTRANRVFEFLWNNGQLLIEGLDWYEGLAGESGANSPAIAANWNNPDRWHTLYGPVMRDGRYSSEFFFAGYRDILNTYPERAARIFDKLEIETVWSDEYLRCECGKGFRVSPSGFDFQQRDYGFILDGDYFCVECFESEQCEDCNGWTGYTGRTGYTGHRHQQPDNIPICQCDEEEDED